MSANQTPGLSDKTPLGYEGTSALQSLLETVAERLRAQKLIAIKGIRVLPEYAGDLYNQLNAVIGKRLGALIQVGFESGNAGQTSGQNMLKDIRLQVHVFESVLFNQGASGTKISALALAERCLTQLNDWTPTATASLVNPAALMMQSERTLFLNEEEAKPEAGMICYTVRLKASACLVCDCDT
jgi:hypothetical protein